MCVAGGGVVSVAHDLPRIVDAGRLREHPASYIAALEEILLKWQHLYHRFPLLVVTGLILQEAGRPWICVAIKVITGFELPQAVPNRQESW